jgi:3-deoxy-D-manno-octulosonic-acid transferase
MIWWLYNIAVFVAAPVWVPWMVWRTRQRTQGPVWKERLGDYPFQLAKGPDRLWIHAVSVGEVMAALPILQAVRRLQPDLEIVMSVTTSTGHQTATDRAGDLVTKIVYFPIDLPLFALNAVARVRPTVVAIMETELWMNFLWASKSLNARTMLLNGRISDRSFPRSRRLRFFYRALLDSVDDCLMQSEQDAERILALGARTAEVVGNCKFDQAAATPSRSMDAWREELGIGEGDRVVVVGSTRSEDEERFVLDALRGFVGRVRVIYAPRQIERAVALCEAARADGWDVGRRSAGDRSPFLVLDTFGELGEVFGVADIAIIGGGFANHGGQNLLQPLAVGVPVLHGPHMQNFRDVTREALRVGASREALDAAALADGLEAWLANESARQAAGAAGLAMVQANVGASEKYAAKIAARLLNE